MGNATGNGEIEMRNQEWICGETAGSGSNQIVQGSIEAATEEDVKCWKSAINDFWEGIIEPIPDVPSVAVLERDWPIIEGLREENGLMTTDEEQGDKEEESARVMYFDKTLAVHDILGVMCATEYRNPAPLQLELVLSVNHTCAEMGFPVKVEQSYYCARGLPFRNSLLRKATFVCAWKHGYNEETQQCRFSFSINGFITNYGDGKKSKCTSGKFSTEA